MMIKYKEREDEKMEIKISRNKMAAGWSLEYKSKKEARTIPIFQIHTLKRFRVYYIFSLQIKKISYA